MTTKPRRRWFSFTLRTLFVLVTVIGCALGWLGWQVEIVHERNKLISELRQASPRKYPANCVEDSMLPGVASPVRLKMLKQVVRVPFWRRALGDQTYEYLQIPPTMTSEWIARADRAFPEANLYIEASDGSKSTRRARYERKPRSTLTQTREEND